MGEGEGCTDGAQRVFRAGNGSVTMLSWRIPVVTHLSKPLERTPGVTLP